VRGIFEDLMDEVSSNEETHVILPLHHWFRILENPSTPGVTDFRLKIDLLQ
jgi:hypothetical protein